MNMVSAISSEASSLAQQFLEESRNHFFLRLWVSRGEPIFETRVVHLFSLKTFRPNEACVQTLIPGAIPQEMTLLCEAKFAFSTMSVGLYGEPTIKTVDLAGIEEWALGLPEEIRNPKEWSMCTIQGRIIKQSNILAMVPLMIWERKLADMSFENKSFELMRYLLTEMLSKNNTRSWQVVYGIFA